MNARELDGVTIDAYGTLMTLVDPFPRLEELLPGHTREDIERAFSAEGNFYRTRTHTAVDEPSLAALREECVSVFNEELGSSLSAEEYAGVMQFEPLPGVREALDRLHSLGLRLAVVGNWDWSLHEWLETSQLASFFTTVVPAANKPAPDGILRALEILRVQPGRALHIGDEETDERAARAAGVHFLTAPLSEAVASLG